MNMGGASGAPPLWSAITMKQPILRLAFGLCIIFLAPVLGCGGGNGLGMNKVLAVVQAQKSPLDDAVLEGIWNHPSRALIAVVHKEGDEYRLAVAVGDMRKELPLGEIQVEEHGPMPDDAARARAIGAIEGWESGKAVGGADSALFVLAGKATKDGQSAMGTWGTGADPCSGLWGNFYFHLARDTDGDPVLFLRIFATTEKMEGGIGGQGYDYDRMIWLTRSDNPIKPSVLDKLKNADNFCRKTAEE